MSDSMEALELLPDFDEPTQPATPSGVRLRQMHTEEGAMLRIGKLYVSALEQRASDRWKKHLDRMGMLVSTIESWSLMEPEADVRQRTRDSFEALVAAVLNQAVGNR